MPPTVTGLLQVPAWMTPHNLLLSCDEVADAGAKPAAPILRDEAEEGASD